MKKLLLLLCLPLALACGESPGPDPVPTPGPEPVGTPVPVPTVVVEPCISTGAGSGDKLVYKGGCAPSATCKDGGDGFFYGSACQTK